MKPICIDTNIIIRHLIDEDDKLNQLFKLDTKIFLPLPIIFETIFVLQKIYQIPRQEIIDGLNPIISSKQIDTDKQTYSQTTQIYLQKTGLSIIDCYLLVFSQQTNSQLITYDKKLSKASSKP